MRPEYDFSGAARGVTAARYTKEQTSWSWIQRFLMFSPMVWQSVKLCELWPPY